jgi:hypothetical protein
MNLIWREEGIAAPPKPGVCEFKPNPAAARVSQHRFAAVMLLVDVIILVLAGLTPTVVYTGLEGVSLDQYLANVSGGLLLFLLIARPESLPNPPDLRLAARGNAGVYDRRVHVLRPYAGSGTLATLPLRRGISLTLPF